MNHIQVDAQALFMTFNVAEKDESGKSNNSYWHLKTQAAYSQTSQERQVVIHAEPRVVFNKAYSLLTSRFIVHERRDSHQQFFACW